MIGIKANCLAGALLIGLLIKPAIGASEIEIMGVWGNDTFFNSDGSGVTGSVELVARIDAWHMGAGLYVVTPELLAAKRPNDDPLAEISRLNLWVGKTYRWHSRTDVHISVRAGLEGGVVDDLGFHMQEISHDLIGNDPRDLESTHDTRGVLGVSGWARGNWAAWEAGHTAIKIISYAHASLGSETIEGGGGLMASLQPEGATELPALLLPKNGSYAPVFGGDSISLYAGARGVVHESFYDDLKKPLLGEVGLFVQKTIFKALTLGAGASFTTPPYEGAIGSDGKIDLRVSYRW